MNTTKHHQSDEHTEPPRPKQPTHSSPSEISEVYQIVVECASEDEQRRLYHRFNSEGLKIRLLVL